MHQWRGGLQVTSPFDLPVILWAVDHSRRRFN